MPSRHKFAGEQDPRHDGYLHYGANLGFPVKADAMPLLKPHEQEQMPLVGNKKVAFFDLADPEHLGYYTWIQDHARNNAFTVDFIQRFFDPAGCRVLVYVEWTQLYYIPPTGGRGVYGT